MSDYLAGFYPDFVEKEEPRQIILDLGKMITNRIPVKLGFQKLNKYDPEYWGLAMLLTDEQAEVALKMGVRKPKTMADMVKLTGKTEEELEKIAKLDMYVIQKFRVAFGNRIMKQLCIFVPVYVACGGTATEAIDYLLATKVFRKFEALNLSLIRDEIKGLISYLDQLYGKGAMAECIAYLERLRKMY